MNEENKNINLFLFEVDKYDNITTHWLRLIVTVIIGILLLTGTYRINTGEGAILTEVSGQKVPINNVGWHFKTPLLTSLNSYSIVNNNIYFPQDYIVLEQKFTGDAQSGAVGFDIKTTDDKVVDVGAVMQYQITDLVQYGVMNANPTEQLQKAFDAVVFNHLQSLSSDKIINEIEVVNNELLTKLHMSNIESQFGIKVTSVSLLRPTYTKKALDAMSEKQALQAIGEGKLNAAASEAKAIEMIATAMKKQSDILASIPPDQMDFNAKMTLYNNLKGQPNVIWVIPQNQQITISK